MKKSIYYFIAISIIAAVVILPHLSCKKEAPHEAIATFIVGDVTLTRQKDAPRQIKHGDKLAVNDIIKTGKDSLFAFQVGESAVVRVTADSSVLIADILSGKTNRFVLDQGRVLASVKKLGKGASYEVQTKTTVAAVRGTEFSVSYDKGQCVVAVKEGAVKVQRVKEDSTVAEETMVEGGNAAVVTKTASETRPVNKEETDEFAKVEKIVIIVDVHEKSESDLKDIEQKVLHGDEVAPEPEEKAVITPEQKGETPKVEEKSTVQETPVAKANEGDSKEGSVWTSKNIYKSEDPIVIGYKNIPSSRYCWISVAKAGAAGGDFVRYDWTGGKTDGQMVWEGLGLSPGNYEARVHFSRSRNVSKRSFFKVE